MSIINEASKAIHQQRSVNDELTQDWLLQKGLHELRSQSHLADVVLVVGKKKLQPCHRSVLAASSAYFRAMFTHNLVEQNQPEIEIKDLDFLSVSSIVDYLYSSKIEIHDENAQDLLTACSILQIPGLYGKCIRYIQKRLTEQNCIEVYSFAKTLCCTELQNDAFALTTRKFADICETQAFISLNKDDLIDIISSDELGVDNEEVVYESVLSWLLHDIITRGLSINEVFSHVRFALLKDDYLENCIAQEQLIMEFPHLCAQVTAARVYKACKSNHESRSACQLDQNVLPENPEKSEPEDSEKNETENPEKSKPEDSEKSEPENPEKIELEDPEKSEPVDPAKSEPVDPAKSEPVDPAKSEPVDPAKSEPVDSANSEPVDPAKSEPVDSAKSEPVDPAKSEPVDPAKSEHVDPAKSEPVDSANSEPVDSANSEPEDPAKRDVSKEGMEHENKQADKNRNKIDIDLGEKHGAKASGDTSKNSIHSSFKSLKEENTFYECPFYEAHLSNHADPIKIPLEVIPRSGMLKSDLLLFTNGRKTIILDPICRRYFCGTQSHESRKECESTEPPDERPAPGLDPNMPIMKNAEVFSARSGIVYLIGGLEVDRSSLTPTLRSRLFTFDAKSLKWISRKSLDEPRCMIGMGELDGCFVVTGGKALSNGEVLPQAQMYSFEKDSWRDLAPMPKAVYGHQCASAKKKLFVIGGKAGEREIEKSVYILDASTHQWSETCSLNVPRFLAGATVLQSPNSRSKHREVIYVIGGVGSDGILSSVELLNPAVDNRWKFEEDFPGNRCAQVLTSLNGNLCAVGGHVTERNDEGRYESVQKYDAFSLETYSDADVTSEGRHWCQIIRHIRGIFGASCACTSIRLDKNKLYRAFYDN